MAEPIGMLGMLMNTGKEIVSLPRAFRGAGGRTVWLLGGLASLSIMVGCGTHGCGDAAVGRAIWVRNHGGLLSDRYDRQRLEVCAQPLVACLKTPVRLDVLNSDTLSAYAWPDGSVYLTAGVMKVLNEEQLSAVVAHEVGHLLDQDTEWLSSHCRGTPHTLIARRELTGLDASFFSRGDYGLEP